MERGDGGTRGRFFRSMERGDGSFVSGNGAGDGVSGPMEWARWM